MESNFSRKPLMKVDQVFKAINSLKHWILFSFL